MATFYLLPPRECLERAVAEFVARIAPGLPAPPAVAESLFAAVESAAGPGLFLVHREDLPGDDPAAELADGFGAEPGDEVVEVGPAAGTRPAAVKRWAVPEPAAAR